MSLWNVFYQTCLTKPIQHPCPYPAAPPSEPPLFPCQSAPSLSLSLSLPLPPSPSLPPFLFPFSWAMLLPQLSLLLIVPAWWSIFGFPTQQKDQHYYTANEGLSQGPKLRWLEIVFWRTKTWCKLCFISRISDSGYTYHISKDYDTKKLGKISKNVSRL